MTEAPPPELFDKLVSLAKRRGFVFPSSEIYGGAGATWDFGPLGVELKNNVKRAWWRSMVQLRDDVVGLDAAILMHPKVWEASGHVENFIDPLVECGNCHHRFRVDDLPDGSFLFTVEVSEPREVGWWVMQWGANAEVLEPESLRQELAETARALVVVYEK